MRSPDPAVRAVVVNHNTSAWVELAMRSLFAQHAGIDVTLTIYDNASTDDQHSLREAATELEVPIVGSGFTTETSGNSHGEVLSRFVLDPANQSCAYFLFVDADVCFTQPRTIERLARALEADETAFGAGPRMSWDGETLPAHERSLQAQNPSIYEARLHPGCALVRNTPLFRAVVRDVGLSCAELLWAGRREYLDTFELTTRVLRTHGQHHLVVDEVLVMHAFGVSYRNDWESTLPAKQARRDAWLARFRR